MRVLVVSVCAVLLAAGIVAAVLWGGTSLRRPWLDPIPEPDDADASEVTPLTVAKRCLWLLVVGTMSGIGAGVLVAGAGGRLVMRLLALTSDQAAQGKKTEAEQVVGAITAGGTIGFVLFTALFFGLGSGLGYVLLQPVLPRGRWSGVTYGALLFVLGATRFEPLRPGNEDFDIVGPSAVAVAAYAALVVLHGMTVAALAARGARGLPLFGDSGPFPWRYLWLILLAPVVPIALPLFVVLAVVAVLSRFGALRRLAASPGLVLGGRAVLIVLTLVALPWTVGDLGGILGRA